MRGGGGREGGEGEGEGGYKLISNFIFSNTRKRIVDLDFAFGADTSIKRRKGWGEVRGER